MSLRHTIRLATAALLVASAALVGFSVTPAGAANTPVTLNCPNSGMNFSPAYIGFNDTVTLIVGTGCVSAQALGNQSGFFGSVTLNAAPLAGGQTANVVPGDVIVFTAPASGANSVYLLLSPNNNPPTAQVGIYFPIPTGSMTDNGDGSMTVTFTGWPNLYLQASGSTCPTTRNQGDPYLYVLSANATAPQPMQLGASPATVNAGRTASGPSGPNSTIAAGVYQACLYGQNLLQSLTVGIGAVVPTTTTTTAADPVAPAYTG